MSERQELFAEQIELRPDDSFVRVAACTPEVSVGDVAFNVEKIIEQFQSADEQHVDLAVFPEMAITSYTIADLVQHKRVLDNAMTGLDRIREATEGSETAIMVGLPVVWGDNIYNAAAMVAGGEVKGIVPKVNLPNYKEFFEQRWFTSGAGLTGQTIKINGQEVPFGIDLLFESDNGVIAAEICEDLWVADQPSIKYALAGANIIVNPSASNELIGKPDYRRLIVGAQSGRLICAYVYVSAGVGESAADTVFSGHNIISENSKTLKESERFVLEGTITVSDIDTQDLSFERRVNRSFETDPSIRMRRIKLPSRTNQPKDLMREVDPRPFEQTSPELFDQNMSDGFNIQAHGLVKQMREAGIENVTLGLSGGLDSTLALLVAIKAMKIMGKGPENILTFTMPGYASSEITQDSASIMANRLGTTHKVLPIDSLSDEMLRVLEHNGEQDVTYENVQARMRTSILMNKGNQEFGMVLGTGDLSEIMQGFCTFNGDHMSNYNVNSGAAKTYIQKAVLWASEQPQFASVKELLEDVVARPISPELTSKKEGEIDQVTEDILGPFVLSDFFGERIFRRGETIQKAGFLAAEAFKGEYSSEEIAHWLSKFMNNFAKSQHKRESAPNGVKLGGYSASQRTDMRVSPSVSPKWAEEI